MDSNDLKVFKIVKTSQLIFLCFIGILSFLMLVFHPALQYSVFHNTNLFILCSFIWILLIGSFFFLLFDYARVENIVSASHELSRATYLDNLTGIPNRYSCDLIFESYKTAESIADIGCCVLTITNLLEINQLKSHQEGDAIIQHFSSIFESVGDRYGFVGRNGGNEFLIVINHCTDELMQEFLNQLNHELNTYNELHLTRLEISYAYALNQVEHVTRFADLVAICCHQLQNQGKEMH